MRPISFLLVLFFFSSCKQEETTILSKNSWVDPFIGTGFHGHTYPGATSPHGQIQLSPDTHILGWEASSGYHYDDTTLYGFSHNHLSGTGIGDLGDFLFLPFTGIYKGQKPVGQLNHHYEKAVPGWYQILLEPWGIEVQLTATERVGWHQYSFPQDTNAKVMIDLNHVLQPNWGHHLKEASLTFINPYTIKAYRKTSGWAMEDPIWMLATFDHPIQKVELLDSTTQKVHKIYPFNTEDPYKLEGQKVITYLDFGRLKNPLQIKVSISNTSEQGTELNHQSLDPSLTFEEVKKATADQWEHQLDAITIQTKDSALLTNFYTAMYHSHLAPLLFSDADGSYRGLNQEIYSHPETKRYSAYSLWDVFRSWVPLMTLIEPDLVQDWCYDLLNQSKEGGLLPKWPLNGNYTGTMVGYPAVAVFYDALQKGLIDSIPEEFLTAALRSSQWQPEFAQRHQGTRAARVMPQHIYYKENQPHIPYNRIPESVSYGLELAFYDWCIAGMAHLLKNEAIEAAYREKSTAYKAYFDSSVGFMRGRHEDGSWEPDFDPFLSVHLDGPFVEGNSWQWTPLVLHDPEGLRDLMGGATAFGEWLDELFSASSKVTGENASMDITGLIGQYAHGNEPSHHVPFLYQWTDRPWRTNEILDTILYNFYQPTPDGIIGNEDCGQMSAWYILNALGLYQMTPGNTSFFIGRPIVDGAKIKMDTGYFTIKVHNNSKQNKYLEKASLNGVLLQDFSINFSDIKSESILEIWMSNEKNIPPI